MVLCHRKRKVTETIPHYQICQQQQNPINLNYQISILMYLSLVLDSVDPALLQYKEQSVHLTLYSAGEQILQLVLADKVNETNLNPEDN